jgi:hypothetical protein
VTLDGSPNYVALAEGIAVFDNDGTLWCENPVPFQLAFALDELMRRVPLEPVLETDPMVQAALAGDFGKLLEGKHHDGLLRIIAITHAGMTTEEFADRVKEWPKVARHPRFGKAYSDLTYQPRQKLLRYLYTTIGNPRPSLGLIVHHTDTDREYAFHANPRSRCKLTTALEVTQRIVGS